MRFKQVVHPEIVLDKRGPELFRLLYRRFLPKVNWDADNKEFFAMPIVMKTFDELMLDHFALVRRFLIDKGPIYHVTKDFLTEIAKVDKAIPLDRLPKRFIAYISFAKETIKDDAGYIQGAYVYVGPMFDTSLGGLVRQGKDRNTPTLWVSYVNEGESPPIASLRLELRDLNVISEQMKGLKAEEHIGDVTIQTTPESRIARDIVYRTLLNIVCYIHQPDPDLERVSSASRLSNSQRSKLNAGGLCNESTLPITFINWKWKRPVSEQLVTGHFKWAACGPQMSERKLIWVNAYERGNR
jgi:hypothetical protein